MPVSFLTLFGMLFDFEHNRPLVSEYRPVGLDADEVQHAPMLEVSPDTDVATVVELMNAKRKIRVAKGSGTTVQEVNKLLKMHQEMANAMKKIRKMGGLGKLGALFGGGAGGLGGALGGLPGGATIQKLVGGLSGGVRHLLLIEDADAEADDVGHRRGDQRAVVAPRVHHRDRAHRVRADAVRVQPLLLAELELTALRGGGHPFTLGRGILR